MERTLATGYNTYTDEQGRFHFADKQADVVLSEDVSGHTIYWDEYAGYILDDGRNVRDLIAEQEAAQ
jgi:hypothetical protein